MLFNGSAIKVIIDVITAGICQRDFNYTREFREMASTELSKICLLYTSAAADDLL